jgi:hypothetical protein
MAAPWSNITSDFRFGPASKGAGHFHQCERSMDRHDEIWNAAIKAAARCAAQEWDQKPIVAPLTNAAYDEAARTIEANILALIIGSAKEGGVLDA